MFSKPNAQSVAEACLSKKQSLQRTVRDGQMVWVVTEGKKDVLVTVTIEEMADKLEAEARKQPLQCTSPSTHLFGAPCTVEFGARRGEFYLVQGGLRVELSWVDTGTRWVGYTECGQKLKYGPMGGKRNGEFKLDWTEKDREQPALKAWLAR